MNHHTTDILILGAGLAGLRAAWAALEADPEARVLVVSARNAPAGSSFANRNAALGMQVLRTEPERELYARRASYIAKPGVLVPELLDALMHDSEARFHDLRQLGVSFRREENSGEIQWFPGCFLPELPTAAILTRLGDAHKAFVQRVTQLGGEFLTASVVNLLCDKSSSRRAICGAMLRNEKTGEERHVLAKSVVLALGGPASLFAWDVSGPGNSGVGYALLHRAGARMANLGFLQFLWHERKTGVFFPVQELAQPGGAVLNRSGAEIPLPEELHTHAAIRGAHCPYSYGLPDRAIDIFVAAHADEQGRVRVRRAGGDIQEIYPGAHAGNGGAHINAQGATSVEGLYACGENATGMHGADRIGGAMVLATQVFGARAGKTAALYAQSKGDPIAQKARPLPPRFPDAGAVDELERAMQRHALFGGGAGASGLEEFMPELKTPGERLATPIQRLRQESALLICEHLLSLPEENH